MDALVAAQNSALRGLLGHFDAVAGDNAQPSGVAADLVDRPSSSGGPPC